MNPHEAWNDDTLTRYGAPAQQTFNPDSSPRLASCRTAVPRAFRGMAKTRELRGMTVAARSRCAGGEHQVDVHADGISLPHFRDFCRVGARASWI